MLGIFSAHECSVNVGHKFAGMVAKWRQMLREVNINKPQVY